MASRTRFWSGYTVPVLLLGASIAAFAWLLPRSGFLATKLLLGVTVVLTIRALWARTRRTNLATARFVSALTRGDLQQSFARSGTDSGFGELGRAFDGALDRVRRERIAAEAQNRFATALVDEAPTPLLAIDPDGPVLLANKAARRLFVGQDGRPPAAFARFGDGFASALTEVAPGRRRSCRIEIAGAPERAVLAAASVERAGRRWRVVAVHVIQNELDAAEMATQTDLVRVLTHEIMNSMTPVLSLAETASRLIAEADRGQDATIADARAAIDALARRAAGIARFVESYRAFSQTPALRLSRFVVRPWLDALARAFAAMPAGAGIALSVSVEPEALMLRADADLLGQVLLNLMKNGGEAAAAATANPTVAVVVRSTEDDRILLSVTDNGPGIAPDLREEIFLPFFTTKAEGTGVGLSFARRVILLHGGTIGIGDAAPAQGARFEIRL